MRRSAVYQSLCGRAGHGKRPVQNVVCYVLELVGGAVQVMLTLKDLAAEGKTVVVTIHQPRSSIFALFDDLVLLAEGALVYGGPAVEAVGHFRDQGFQCPPNYNPAEFLADLISVDHSSPEAEAHSQCGPLPESHDNSQLTDVHSSTLPCFCYFQVRLVRCLMLLTCCFSASSICTTTRLHQPRKRRTRLFP